MVSSHVLDEVERFGSRILVIAQGRLAAEGDFRAIRDLMDDRPHRLRLVSTDRPRRWPPPCCRERRGGRRARRPVPTGPRWRPPTSTASGATVAVAARDVDARLDEVVPLDDDLDSVFRYLVGR